MFPANSIRLTHGLTHSYKIGRRHHFIAYCAKSFIIATCLPTDSCLHNCHLNLTLTLTSTVKVAERLRKGYGKVTERSWKASVGETGLLYIPRGHPHHHPCYVMLCLSTIIHQLKCLWIQIIFGRYHWKVHWLSSFIYLVMPLNDCLPFQSFLSKITKSQSWKWVQIFTCHFQMWKWCLVFVYHYQWKW